MSAIRTLLGPAAKIAKENPMWGILGGAAIGHEVVGPTIASIVDEHITGASLQRQQHQIESVRSMKAKQLSRQVRNASIQENIRRNQEILAMRDPHLYAQVMAGRHLPQDAVVLGGAPRQDLMEELAQHMGSLPTPGPFDGADLFQQ